MGYTGHQDDVATGLTYMQARYYDPVVGRFMAVDPVTFMNTGNPSMFNRYTYAFNNPITFFDPDGRETTTRQEALEEHGLEDPSAGVRENAEKVANATDTAADVVDSVVSDPTTYVPGAAIAKATKVAGTMVRGAKGADKAAAVLRSANPRALISRQGRSEMSGSKVKTYKKDMQQNGFDQNQPIDVADADGRMIILDGHHRAEAAAWGSLVYGYDPQPNHSHSSVYRATRHATGRVQGGAFPGVSDWQFLLDAPWSGEVIVDGDTWSFRKHGAGLSFRRADGLTIDAHRHLSVPEGIDAWRLLEYLESSDVDREEWLSERLLKKELARLEKEGQMISAQFEGLYRQSG